MTTKSSNSNRPRLWRLQFSLKLLFIAFTAFAIGFPIWYRWPYEERDSVPASGVEIITTWQRQWGGGRKKHGVQRLLESGELVELTTYKNGIRHGQHENQGYGGRYDNGLKEGEWTDFNRVSHWHNGKLDGPMVVTMPSVRLGYNRHDPNRPRPVIQQARKMELIFAEGRLTHLDGKPMVDARGKSPANRLFELQGTGEIDARTDAELGKQTTVDVVEMPLKDVALYLSDVHNIPIVLDPGLGPNMDLPLTAAYRGIDLRTVFLLLTVTNGLACDYRYGSVWITAADESSDWRDRTGLLEIKPPPGSALARAWNEISRPIDAVETPLTEILAYLKQPLAIDIDTTQIEETSDKTPPPLVTASLRGLRFCDTLGHLLYRTGCRCRLDGDKLVILRPLEKPPVQKAIPTADAGMANKRPRVVPAPQPPPADPLAPPWLVLRLLHRLNECHSQLMHDRFQEFRFIVREIALRLLLQNVQHVNRMPPQLQPYLRLAIDGIGCLPKRNCGLRGKRSN